MDTSGANAHAHRLDTDYNRLRLVPEAPVGSSQHRFERAFNDQRHCDLRIRTSSSEIQVHELVMCLASKVICRAVHSNYREAREKTYDLSQDGHRVPCAFVQFCYQGWYNTIKCGSHDLLSTGILHDYDRLIRVDGNLAFYRSAADLDAVKKVAMECNSRRLHMDVEMWKMGDIYDVPSLKSQAGYKLEWRLYEYSCSEVNPGPILDLIAPVYEYTESDRNVLRRLLFRGLRRFRTSIRNDQTFWATLLALRSTVRGFDAASRSIFLGRSAHLPDVPFAWPSSSPIPRDLQSAEP